jgi:hypothetical protein
MAEVDQLQEKMADAKVTPNIVLGIVGSRDYNNATDFAKVVNGWIQKNGKPTLIVSGGAKGADELAEIYAKECGIPLEVIRADWNSYGRKAGPMRNSQIVQLCSHILAFPSHQGKGTQDTMAKAKRDGKHLTIHYVDQRVPNKTR